MLIGRRVMSCTFTQGRGRIVENRSHKRGRSGLSYTAPQQSQDRPEELNDRQANQMKDEAQAMYRYVCSDTGEMVRSSAPMGLQVALPAPYLSPGGWVWWGIPVDQTGTSCQTCTSEIFLGIHALSTHFFQSFRYS